ncbi:MAG: tetratricopeptide repeat protein, partial [Gemmatimonadales bacterium]
AYESSLGSTHPHTVACITNLAVVARALKDRDNALELARQAADDFHTVLGAVHPFTLDARTNLAICLAESGNRVAGTALLAETEANVTAVFGPDHPVTLRCRANLSLMGQREGGQPRTTVEPRILEQLAEKLGSTHPVLSEFRDGRLVARAIDPHPF